jgi:peroxiredoxin family protein/sulfur relay (sulfurtransferase) DsrC/TusE family protein
MPTRVICGKTIHVNDEGFMTVPDEWDKDIAGEIAREEGIPELSPQHWVVIEFCRQSLRKTGAAPPRAITSGSGVSTKELFAMFPERTGRKLPASPGLANRRFNIASNPVTEKTSKENEDMDTNGERKVAFICSKGNLDMAYPALIMGWAALGNGIDVTIFFTFWGMDLITKDRVDRLEIAPVANTSMKMSMMGVDTGNLGIPNIMGVLPGMTAFATKLMKDKMEKLEVPPVREYLQMLVDAGAKLYACKMSVDMMDLKKEEFVDGVIDIVTAGDLMDMTENIQIIFI